MHWDSLGALKILCKLIHQSQEAVSGADLVLGVVLVEPDDLPLLECMDSVHDVLRFDVDGVDCSRAFTPRY